MVGIPPLKQGVHKQPCRKKTAAQTHSVLVFNCPGQPDSVIWGLCSFRWSILTVRMLRLRFESIIANVSTKSLVEFGEHTRTPGEVVSF